MIPVLDIFAGPGGLGEGFAAFRVNDRPAFRVALSIEKDEHAYETLLLRSFYRQYSGREVPSNYYRCLRGELIRQDLFRLHPSEAKTAALEAWRAELGKTPQSQVDERIRQSIGNVSSWVLIGGPPCQAYSIVGRVRIKGDSQQKYDSDPRHFLYREYLRILRDYRPPVFVMENVKGILSATVKGKPILERILADLRALKYSLHTLVRSADEPDFTGNRAAHDNPATFVIESERYGIPQARHRVIIIGVREDLKAQPRPLEEVTPPVTLWDAIQDLPPLRSLLSREHDSASTWEKTIRQVFKSVNGELGSDLKTFMLKQIKRLKSNLDGGGEFVRWDQKAELYKSWFGDPRLHGVLNHSSRRHMGADLRRYFFAACFGLAHRRSPVLADFPRALLPEHDNVEEGIDSGTFRDRFRVQLKYKPATTITSHIRKDGHYFIHPDPGQCRSLTVREAARLQTFPDNYWFSGPRTAQYQQVGNAVPPLLARDIARIVFNLFCSKARSTR
jgi:DNA (cytosine-5)-methyltransferase 1